MKIALSITKSVEENAAVYFEEAKRAKKKIRGVEKTLAEFAEKKDGVEDDLASSEFVSSIKRVEDKQKFWFEKFRWSISSEGFLLIGGRDATTNEILIKKHTEKDDVVLHTDMAGSPFAIIKKNKKDVEQFFGIGLDDKEYPQEPTNQSITEAGSFVLDYARAWKLGMGTAAVFHVKPEQVTKDANSGEFLAKGSFMIRGKTNYIDASISFAMGLLTTTDVDERVVVLAGPTAAVRHHCKQVIEIEQGKEKASVIAKQIRNFFVQHEQAHVSLDAIIRVLPSGGCQVKKIRKRKNEL
ncbi:NFACT RNA binding domain-containing protein [Candidatus Woesearchaeota archaeon]|nr:NFACT RNA binding domain-containing protein [Candidatus Woesearchaeota archaeon]